MNGEFTQLTGTWYGQLPADPSNHVWFRILPDGRYIGFFPRNITPPFTYGCARFRFAPVSPGVIQVRFREGAAGWLTVYHFEGEKLFLLPKTAADSGHPYFDCRRVTPEELPEWFEERFAQALAKEWL